MYSQGLVDADAKVADMLRRSQKPVVLVVNKVDSVQKFMPDVYEFYNLGIGDPIPISAAIRSWDLAICWMRWSSISREALMDRRGR